MIEQAPRLLPDADPRASKLIGEVFAREGITLRAGTPVEKAGIDPDGPGCLLHLTDSATVAVARLLVAAGRTPVTSGLGLADAGVATDGRGAVTTNQHLATTGIWTSGDCTGLMPFIHAAYAMGRVAARNALRRRWSAPGSFSTAAIPRAVFTEPEVAHIGMTEEQAATQVRGARVAYLPMRGVDRAVTAGRTEGFVKLIAGPRRLTGSLGGQGLLGATSVASRAGEMIDEIALAMRAGMFTGRLAQTAHAYPTWSLAIQQAAAQFFGGYGGRTARPAGARET